MPRPRLRPHATIPAPLPALGGASGRLRSRWNSRRRAWVGRSIALALALGCAGCQRGCLRTWLEDHGAAGRPTAAPPLEGTDCSDGLVRCVDGRLESSRLAHLPYPCGGANDGTKACVCPWQVVGTCRAGCAEDGLEIAMTAEAGADQLCRTLAPVARPVLAEDHAPAAGVCPESGTRCVDGIVVDCEAPGLPERPIARCIFGCEPGIDLPDEAPAPGGPRRPDGRVSILCRHADAERR